MDLDKLLRLALDIPGMASDAAKFARGAAEFAALVKVNADRARHVIAAGDRGELDRIHAEALAAADVLDAKLARVAGELGR